jgi:cytochrome P450
VGDDAWTEAEVLGLSLLFTLAGLEPATASIGFIFVHLARWPDLRADLVRDPDLASPPARRS